MREMTGISDTEDFGQYLFLKQEGLQGQWE
jgi:hypothetical protein